MQNRCYSGCAHADEGIDNQVIFICQSQYQPFREFPLGIDRGALFFRRDYSSRSGKPKHHRIFPNG